jgi:hypothetical protein
MSKGLSLGFYRIILILLANTLFVKTQGFIIINLHIEVVFFCIEYHVSYKYRKKTF